MHKLGPKEEVNKHIYLPNQYNYKFESNVQKFKTA